MKRIALVLLLMSLTTGCTHGFLNQVRGSGNRQRQTRQVAPFTSISTEGAFEIRIVSQKPFSLEIEGDDNVLPLIGTDVSGNVLYIKNQKGYSVSKPVKIELSLPNLEALTSSGAGNIEVTALKNEKLEVEINGAPAIELAGETSFLKIKANGAGKIDSHKLRAANADVNSNGVSRINVYARDKLDIVVNGPSHVTYEGDPAVKQTVNGPGSVQKKGSEGS